MRATRPTEPLKVIAIKTPEALHQELHILRRRLGFHNITDMLLPVLREFAAKHRRTQ
ncbi:MAG: hypothetical protein ACE15D_18630 [Candidatus Eisenbacteria bacterium]